MGEHYEPFAAPADLTTRLLAALDSEERIMEVATLYVVGGLRRIVARHKVVRWHFSTHDVETCRCGDERYPCPDLRDLADALGVEP